MDAMPHLPDYQRAAMVFIDTQIQHCQEQMKKLREARAVLGGGSSSSSLAAGFDCREGHGGRNRGRYWGTAP